jgi:CRP/FNR family transcriptional activator FtrB
MDQAPVSPLSLEELPLLRGLAAEARDSLVRNAIQHSVPAGTVLFEQGSAPTFQIVVLSGTVQLFGRSIGGREVLVETVGSPELIIPAAVVTNAPYLMQARVPEPSTLLLIQAEAFRSAVFADPAVAHAVIDSLAEQFRRMVKQIKNLKLRTSTQRVGCYVLALSERQGTPGHAVLPYEKSLIASELGIVRESFSRALTSLEVWSVEVKGNTISIRDPELLARECEFDSLIDGLDVLNNA